MALWAFIPGKHIVAVGPLPLSAQRLDTGQWEDLTGDGVQWARACGWWDLDNIDAALLTATNNLSQADLTVLVAERQAARQARDVRSQFVDKVHVLTDMARDQNWDWLDAYCDTTVAAFPFVRDQSPNAGAIWPTLAALDKAEKLRFGVSLLMVDVLRIAQAIDLILDALVSQIASSPLTPPPDR